MMEKKHVPIKAVSRSALHQKRSKIWLETKQDMMILNKKVFLSCLSRRTASSPWITHQLLGETHLCILNVLFDFYEAVLEYRNTKRFKRISFIENLRKNWKRSNNKVEDLQTCKEDGTKIEFFDFDFTLEIIYALHVLSWRCQSFSAQMEH